MDTLELKKHIADALAKYPDEVSRYHNGQTGLVGVFCGEVMFLSKGKADPKTLVSLITEALNATATMDTETTTPAHTPTPWRVEKTDGKFPIYQILVGEPGESDEVCRLHTATMSLKHQQEANAQLIVTAVNSHDSNVKRIAELEALLKEFAVHKNDDCVITRICRCGYDQKILSRFK